MGRQPGSIIAGIGLIVIGAWIVVLQLGVKLARLQHMWPALVAMLGLVFLVQYVFQKRKQGGLIFLGIAGLLIGIFLNLFTYGVGGLTWTPQTTMPPGATSYSMANLWPIIPLSLAIALLTLYLAEGMRQQSLLILTYIAGGLGLLALPITLRVVQGPVFSQALQLWPILVVLIALAILVPPRSQRRDPE